MGLITGVTLPNNGDRIKVENYNDPINKIITQVNGNLDSNNISSVSGTKITAGTIPVTAFDTTVGPGWVPGVLPAVSSVTYNGNRSYDVTYASTVASYLTPGMRTRFTRTVAAPTQCTSLDGSTQYYSKTSPAGITFTGSFTYMIWLKLSSYPGSTVGLISRDNSTSSGSGFELRIDANGRLDTFWRNGTGTSVFNTYQAVPLNRWVAIAVVANVSTPSASFYVDGVLVPSTSSSAAATTLVQPSAATPVYIGNRTGTSTGFFPGKIAQAALFSTALSQATIRTYLTQGILGTEPNLVSAWSFNNSISDLNTTNANNLTANGSAVATNADSPFAVDATGTPGGSNDFGIVTKVNGATVTYQVPEGCTIPTSGGVSSTAYSTQKAPFGMPIDENRWMLTLISGGGAAGYQQTSPTINTWYNPGSLQISVPVGKWRTSFNGHVDSVRPSAADHTLYATFSTSTSTETVFDSTMFSSNAGATGTLRLAISGTKTFYLDVTTPTTYYKLVATGRTGANALTIYGSTYGVGGAVGIEGSDVVKLVPAYL